jgi:hypothetical protein
MKTRMIIKDKDGHVLFKGKPAALPFKEDVITNMCIELFDDPEPCIIHASFAAQTLADRILASLPKDAVKDIPLESVDGFPDMLEIGSSEPLFLSVEGTS